MKKQKKPLTEEQKDWIKERKIVRKHWKIILEGEKEAIRRDGLQELGARVLEQLRDHVRLGITISPEESLYELQHLARSLGLLP